jgi:hypothetical protein
VEYVNLNSGACKALMANFIMTSPSLWMEDISVLALDDKQKQCGGH